MHGAEETPTPGIFGGSVLSQQPKAPALLSTTTTTSNVTATTENSDVKIINQPTKNNNNNHVNTSISKNIKGNDNKGGKVPTTTKNESGNGSSLNTMVSLTYSARSFIIIFFLWMKIRKLCLVQWILLLLLIFHQINIKISSYKTNCTAVIMRIMNFVLQ